MLKNYTKITIEYPDKFYLNDEGKLHRLDGPAFECLNGSKCWYVNGNRHRNIDPANEWSDREKRWRFKGEYHRIGGSCHSSRKWWYIDNKEYTKEDYFDEVWKI